MRLSVMSSKETMLSSAKYFEQKGDMQQSVSLYQKAGAVTKALVRFFFSCFFEWICSDCFFNKNKFFK